MQFGFLTHRSTETEILDDPDLHLPDDLIDRSYRDLDRVHRFLGNDRAILRLLRSRATQNTTVLDIGCGQGALLSKIRKQFHCDVIGVDLRPAPQSSPIRILSGNAITDPLPASDIAISVCLIHHLTEDELKQLIRNVARTSRRFIILDLVRHWLPLLLFRTFVAPFLSRINAIDGAISVRRSYTPAELRRITSEAARETGGTIVQHKVAPFYIRQVVDIQW
jgi:SAM-dependent methyltransferase